MTRQWQSRKHHEKEISFSQRGDSVRAHLREYDRSRIDHSEDENPGTRLRLRLLLLIGRTRPTQRRPARAIAVIGRLIRSI